MLAVDNSTSMSGRPLREAKRAAAEFLAASSAGDDGPGRVRARGSGADGARRDRRPTSRGTLASLAPDAEKGTALYDAVGLSVARLEQMSNGTRILVLLTDGRDLGSRSTLAEAIAAAQRANVDRLSRSRRAPVRLTASAELAAATGGRLFDAADATEPRRDLPLARPRARPHVAAVLPLARPPGRPGRADRRAAGASHGHDVLADSRSRDGGILVPFPARSRTARSRPRSSCSWWRSCSPAPAPPGAGGAAPPRSRACSSRTSAARLTRSAERRRPASSPCSPGPSAR